MRRLFTLLQLGLLLLYAGVGPARSADDIKTIGVISAIGDRFELQKVGVTILGNELKEIPIESWKIDEFVVARLRAMLGSRYTVRPVVYQKAPFARHWSSSIYGGCQDCGAVGDVVHDQMSKQNLDAYVVVLTTSHAIEGTKLMTSGLGVIESPGSTLFNRPLLAHANYSISLVDGHRFASRTTTIASPSVDLPNDMPTNYPSREVDRALWPSSPDAARNAKLISVLKDVIDKTLLSGLLNLQLAE